MRRGRRRTLRSETKARGTKQTKLSKKQMRRLKSGKAAREKGVTLGALADRDSNWDKEEEEQRRRRTKRID